jgi:hypothetical protein
MPTDPRVNVDDEKEQDEESRVGEIAQEGLDILFEAIGIQALVPFIEALES